MSYDPFREIGRPFRSQAAATAMIGQTVEILGQSYRVTRHNDLGCLYGVKINGNKTGKTEFVLD
jgi:hypothetical protein